MAGDRKDIELEKLDGIRPFFSSEEIKAEVRKKLIGYALQTYEDLMLTAQSEAVRKSAADSAMEAAGVKGPSAIGRADFHFNIPPEYMKKVFGGVEKVISVDYEKEEDVE
ncbi:hypothetical protein LCGC14_3066740 [marine sediment metagenome]|uniref:Uncharacterized protein n=1 Tax=marine sediment metagenome TaxID=412755 RepID=A0A0F8Z7X8_9ZZZZ